jgi:hypothetical protein
MGRRKEGRRKEEEEERNKRKKHKRHQPLFSMEPSSDDLRLFFQLPESRLLPPQIYSHIHLPSAYLRTMTLSHRTAHEQLKHRFTL